MPAKDKDKLLTFVTNLAGHHFLKVEEELEDGYFRLNIAEAERRQAKHDIRTVEDAVIELLRNSRDAQAKHIFIASTKDSQQLRNLVIIDDGCGVPLSARQLIFEPRVTSKVDQIIEDKYGVHGRGMALFAIKSQVKSAYVVNSEKGSGTVIKVVVDTRQLPEKADQSTWPLVKKNKKGEVSLSGPHNILRVVTEFVLDHPWLNIYLGSPAEILALALHQYSDLPIFRFFSEQRRPFEIKQLALEFLGLDLSLRHVQRVFALKDKLVPAVNERVKESFLPQGKARHKIAKGQIIADEDLQQLLQAVLENAAKVSAKYFLQLTAKPNIKLTNTSIKIEIPFTREED